MKLYETITAENWAKGHGYYNGRRCLIAHWYHEGGDDWTERKRLQEAIALLYPERFSRGDHEATFNDHPDTTVEDVIRVCKLADV